MKQTRNLSRLTTSILIALYPISHNGENYGKGEFLELPKTDAKFLQMAKCVREPTAAELEHWEESQDAEPNVLPVTDMPAVSVITDNHDFKQTKVDDDDMAVSGEVQTVDAVAVDLVVDDAKGGANDADVISEAVDLVETAPEAVVVNEAINPYASWLKKDLNAELDKRGVEHDAGARNDVLEQLLIADDAKLA